MFQQLMGLLRESNWLKYSMTLGLNKRVTCILSGALVVTLYFLLKLIEAETNSLFAGNFDVL
jgi:hypothetical protein